MCARWFGLPAGQVIFPAIWAVLNHSSPSYVAADLGLDRVAAIVKSHDVGLLPVLSID